MRVTNDVLSGLLRPPAPPPKQPTSRERALANRLRVLRTVAEHGHLRCSDLATCWPGAKYGEQMSQRCVRTLVKAGELMPRRNCHGGLSYVLTRVGAAALEVRGIAARHGLDLASVSGPTFTHNALTARWCLHKRAQGFETFTEYALMNGQAPVTAQQLLKRYGKLPDAVLVRGERLWLVETESAPKSTQELMRIAALAEHTARKVHPELPYVLAGVFIVFDAEQNHGARIAKAAAERWSRYSAADRALLASRVTLARVDLGVPLVWRGCSEAPLVLRV
ncbi:hypothetical protein [Methylibium rhizosphaerae]|uniref:hypothetical protein n=1 Tax=Methylibium rhizosphaerae TaxID=2570323 RepID=UPI001125DA9B|nr:hypothetical protein [Methylibium rhizosphaerae]